MKVLLLILAFLTTGRSEAAQVPGSGIQIETTQQISVENGTHPHVESVIAVDPGNPLHLLAASMVVINGEVSSVPYASFDGGKTWARGRMIGDSGVVTGADPVICIARSGTAYFSALAAVNGADRSVIGRSTDGGRSWQWTSILPSADRPWMAVDPGAGPFGGRVYFTGTGVYSAREGGRAVSPFLARSDDDARTFPFRSVVGYDSGGSDPKAPINAVPLEPLVARSGLLVLPLQGSDAKTIERLAHDSLTARTVGLIVSDDGGESFGPARYAPIQLVTLSGGGARRFRATAAFGNIRTALDASSGAYRNRVYFVAPDYDPAIDRYVVRVWSTADFGKTWNTALASDAPRGDVANPAIAVNRDGVVAVVWNDRRDDANGRCWQLYAAISTDGGEHFLPAKRLSLAPTCTNQPQNWQTFGASFNSDQSGRYLAHFQAAPLIPARFPMGGDTQGLAADALGVFHAAWINGETGVMQLWHTSFAVEPAIVASLRVRTPPAADEAAGGGTVPPGMEDVTRDVEFRVTNTKLDFSARTFSVTLAIENRSGRPLYGPLRAVMLHFLDPVDNGMGLGNLAADNADSGGRGVGAVWEFIISGGMLAPGARSEPRPMRFSFEGGIPEIPEGYLTPGFRVYGRTQSQRQPRGADDGSPEKERN